MRLEATCKSFVEGIKESALHCLKDCLKMTLAWAIFSIIWELWSNIIINNSISWDCFILGNFKYANDDTIPHNSKHSYQ
jgi:hypothetical protein